MSKYNCTNCDLIIECLKEIFDDEDQCLKIKLENIQPLPININRYIKRDKRS